MAGKGEEPPPADNLFISNLPEDINDDKLRSVFGQYGSVTRCKILPSSATTTGHCAALVQYQSIEESTWIRENLHDTVPQGLIESVSIRYANPSKKGEKGGGKSDWAGRYQPYGGGGATASTGKGGSMNDALAALAAAGAAAERSKGKGKGWDSGGKGWGQGGNAWDGGWDSGGWDNGGKGKSLDKGADKGWDKGKGGSGNCTVSIKMIVKGLFNSGCLPGGGDDEGEALYVSGLPWDTDDGCLFKIFTPFGALKQKGVRTMTNPDGSCKGFGFVNFIDAASAQSAIATLNGCQLPDGSTLTVAVKTPSTRKGQGKGKEYDGHVASAAAAMIDAAAAMAGAGSEAAWGIGADDWGSSFKV